MAGAHETLPETALATLLPERRAHHLLDIARGYPQIGDLPQAGNTLVRADHLAPAEIRSRPLAHQVMTDLLRRTKDTPPPAVRELAAHMGAGI